MILYSVTKLRLFAKPLIVMHRYDIESAAKDKMVIVHPILTFYFSFSGNRPIRVSSTREVIIVTAFAIR